MATVSVTDAKADGARVRRANWACVSPFLTNTDLGRAWIRGWQETNLALYMKYQAEGFARAAKSASDAAQALRRFEEAANRLNLDDDDRCV